jgi:hypothetical protein
MNTMNQIPNELFILIESKDWIVLLATEKAMVLKYLTQEEYDNMRKIYKATIVLNQANEHTILPPVSIKENLDKQFKAKHQKTIMIPLWQAAAVFLLMLSGFVYYSVDRKNLEKTIVSTIHDTLFVPQYVETTPKLIDTVVIYKYLKTSNNSTNVPQLTMEPTSLRTTQNQAELPVAQIRTLSVEEIKSSIKNVKSKSMDEDTLYRKIGYASI